MNRPASIQVHRFRDNVAVAFLGIDGETVYMEAGLARQLGEELLRAAADVRERPRFSASEYGTVTLQETKEAPSRYRYVLKVHGEPGQVTYYDEKAAIHAAREAVARVAPPKVRVRVDRAFAGTGLFLAQWTGTGDWRDVREVRLVRLPAN